MFDANRVLAPAAALTPALAIFAPKGVAVVFSLTALMALVSLIRQGRMGDVARSWTALIMTLGLMWAGLSIFWAIDPAHVPNRTGQLALLFFAALVTLTLSAGTGEKSPILRQSLLIGVTLGGLLLTWELATEGTISMLAREILDLPGEWSGFKLNGGTALFLILSWPVMFLLRKSRMALYGLAALALLVTILAISTTAKFAVAAAAVVFIFSYAFGPRVNILVAILTAALILTTPLVSITVLKPERVEAVFPEIKQSGLHRLIMWEFASWRIAEKPITGWGLGASRALPGGDEFIPTTKSRYLGKAKFLTLHPHNGSIQAWLELGFPGAALLAALAWLALTGTVRYFRDRAARACGAAAATTAMVFAMSSWSLWQAWWISALALSAALVVAACKEHEPAL